EAPAPPEQPPPAQQPSMNQPSPAMPSEAAPPMPPQTQAPMGMDQTPESTAPAPSGMSERDLCDALTRDTIMRVEDVNGGVAIVLMPKAGIDLTAVRDDAHRVERAMTPEASPGGAQPPPGSADRCALFDLSREGGRAVVSEGPNSIRIIFTAVDQPTIKSMRRHARDFAKNKAGMQQGPMPHEKAPGTQRGGGTQSP